MRVSTVKKRESYGLGVTFRKKESDTWTVPGIITVRYRVLELMVFNRSVYFTWHKEI